MINRDDLNDSLDDILAAPVLSAPRAPTPAQAAIVESFSEVCSKCRGTGRFVSYSGRVLGQCFTCKGKGKFTFKTAPEVRAVNRQRHAAKVATVAQEQAAAAGAWRAEHVAVASWIDAEAERFEFAASMRDALLRFGSLTEKQLATCERLAAKAEERKAAKVAEQAARASAAPAVSVEMIEKAFATASGNGIKRPKLRLGDFLFSLAPATGNNAGAIYVKDRFTKVYYGKVAAGRFHASRECDAAKAASIVEVASTPAASALAYGQRTGTCSICGAGLTKGISIDRGIGPICAGKYGF